MKHLLCCREAGSETRLKAVRVACFAARVGLYTGEKLFEACKRGLALLLRCALTPEEITSASTKHEKTSGKEVYRFA